jgi:hypothetical protein
MWDEEVHHAASFTCKPVVPLRLASLLAACSAKSNPWVSAFVRGGAMTLLAVLITLALQLPVLAACEGCSQGDQNSCVAFCPGTDQCRLIFTGCMPYGWNTECPCYRAGGQACGTGSCVIWGTLCSYTPLTCTSLFPAVRVVNLYPMVPHYWICDCPWECGVGFTHICTPETMYLDL